MLYQEKPNIVKIVMSDASGNAERYAAGISLDDVISQVETILGENPPMPKKARRKRRTKAEIAAAKPQPDLAADPSPDAPAREKKLKSGKGPVWPQEV